MSSALSGIRNVSMPPRMLIAWRVGVWFFLGMLLVLAADMQRTGLRYTADLVSARNTDSTSTFSDAIAAVIALGVIALPTLFVLGMGPAVGRLRPATRPPGRWVVVVATATVMALGVMVFVGCWLAPTLAQNLPDWWTRGTSGETWRSTPVVQQWFQALYAGIIEEFSYLVAPLLAWCGLLSWIDRRRRRRGHACVPQSVYVAGVVGVAVVCMLLRFNLHTYQGLLPALMAVLWSGANIGVFLWSRSLLALIAAHTLYNAVVVGALFGPVPPTVAWVAIVAAVGCAAAIATVHHRRRGTT